MRCAPGCTSSADERDGSQRSRRQGKPRETLAPDEAGARPIERGAEAAEARADCGDRRPVDQGTGARSRAYRQLPDRGVDQPHRAYRLVLLSTVRSDPVFSRLLAGDEEKGFTDIVLADMTTSKSSYLRNTAMVVAELEGKHGGRIRITDFAPRFQMFERTFHPPQLIRRVEPLAGLPRIQIRGDAFV